MKYVLINTVLSGITEHETAQAALDDAESQMDKHRPNIIMKARDFLIVIGEDFEVRELTTKLKLVE